MSETVVREAAMAAALADPALTRDGLEQVFLTEPVHRPLERHTWGTVYTTSYDVVGRSVQAALAVRRAVGRCTSTRRRRARSRGGRW